VKEPKTTLDSRFSDPNAIATDWKETRRILESAQLFWICTVRTDGRPHVTPLVAVWLDGAVHFCTGESEQKALNLKRNSHVVLLTGRNEWEKGIDVVVEGDAVQVTNDAALKRLAKVWTQKWNGQWQYEVRDGAFHHQQGMALVFAVKPTKVLAFAKGKFGQTRHQF
jgi:general stress protein 26